MSTDVKPGCNHRNVTGEPPVIIEHGMPNGAIWKRCQRCGYSWQGMTPSLIEKAKMMAPCPPHYERQRVGWTNWMCEKWGKLKLKNFYEAENIVKQWNAKADAEGIPARYRLPLHCGLCYRVVSETFGPFGACWNCNHDFKSEDTVKPNPEWLKKPVLVKRQEGEIWPIDSALSPIGTKQWGYQGSAKTPYIVTSYKTKRDGSTTADGWACACMSFTRNVPRTHCKHILNVMLGEGIVPANVAKGNAKTVKALANVNDEQLEAFKKWQREQAEKGEKKPDSGDASLNLFGSTGRKFR